ncbi:MAG: HAD hydrolase family protein, partial [Polaromonas sp.]|nr:HAD hydrolase family protein [Polaromonas sp.]
MQALTHWPLAARARITGVFTDIDDTLTTDGAITPDALAALGILNAAGVDVIAITGRSVGWSEPFAQSWPIHAIVAENGAVLLRFMHQTSAKPTHSLTSTLSKSYSQDTATRSANLARLHHAAARVLREVPGAMLAQDSPGRETDIAIDHNEF